MKLEADLLTEEDRSLLKELVERLAPHHDEIVAAWVDELMARPVPAGVDPLAYRQSLTYFNDTVARSIYAHLSRGDVEALYETHYQRNLAAISGQAHGAVVFDHRGIHYSARVAERVISQWIERLYADDPAGIKRIQLAQTRLGYQLSMVLSEAYTDARERYLSDIGQRLQRALEISERLRTVGHAIVQSLDIEPVLDLILRGAIQLLAADTAGLTLVNPDGRTLRLRSLIGAGQSFVGRPIAIDGSLTGIAFRENRPLRCSRVAREFPAAGEALAAGIAAIVVVPLRVQGKPIGTLGVSTRTEHSFSADDERTLQSLADSVAVAVENSRAYAALREALGQTERANRKKSEFIAAVSHEIRSPLNVMLGYVQLLRDGAFGSLTADQVHALGRVERVAGTTLRLTGDLLEHARIEGGKLPVHLEAVALPPLFDDMAETVAVLLGARRVRFATDLPSDTPPVRADPVRLRQILTNLLSNAVKFTDAGEIVLGARTDGESVDITVRDTGVGIAADELPKVFDLFYRANDGDRAGGAGIGLFLSRQLAELMQGRLAVASEAGVGSTFTVSLPTAVA